jgi:hypothetical protein
MRQGEIINKPVNVQYVQREVKVFVCAPVRVINYLISEYFAEVFISVFQ